MDANYIVYRVKYEFSNLFKYVLLLAYLTMPEITFGYSSGSAAVWALFGLAIAVLLGTLVFAKLFPKLDALRDDDFTAAANATIAGVATDFYDGVDLLRIALIIVPIVAVVGYIYLIRSRG